MKRLGGRATGWVGLWAGLLLAGCGGTATQGDTPPPHERVGQPPTTGTPPDESPPSDSTPSASSRWRASLGQGAVSVATDPSGHVYALALDPASKAASAVDTPLVLTKSDAAGKLLWRQSWTTPGSPVVLNAHSLALSPEGNIFLAYTVDCFTTPSCHPAHFTQSTGEEVDARHAVLVKLSPVGKTTWVRTLNPANQERALGVTVNSQGSTILLTRMRDTDLGTLTLFTWEGAELGGYGMRGITAAAFDPEDNVIMGAEGPRLAKLSPDLKSTLWEQGPEGLAEDGAPALTQLGISAKGTIVATGHFTGTLRWGSSVMTARGAGGQGTFLLATEADGSPRWGLAPMMEQDGGELAMAVDPSGQVVLSSSAPGQGNRVFVFRYNLAGEYLWTLQLGNTQDCGAGSGITRVTSLAIAPNHDVLLGGQHTAAADLGSGCVSGSAGFVLDLKP